MHTPAHATSPVAAPASAAPPRARLLSVAASAAVMLCAVLYSAWRTRPLSVLGYVCAGQFAWGASTTDVPISAVSVHLKALLARDGGSLPAGLAAAVPFADTVAVQDVRDFFHAARLERLRALCATRRCRVSERDAKYGLTALHVAAFAGDAPLMAFLEARGAGHVEDAVHRLPRNLSFEHFTANSKRWARAAGRLDCDLPIVDYDGSAHARGEVRRLVSEGEPVLIRGALQSVAPGLLDWDARRFVDAFGADEVTVGAVPYAGAFNLTTTRMSLREYYDDHVAARPGGPGAPLYVFSKGAAACRAGYDALAALVRAAFPTPGLVADPEDTGGAGGTHFFLGARGSGAPLHIHADAVNAAVSGEKRWFIFTPRATLYSRKPVQRWVAEDLPRLPEARRPLECTQRPGDVIYIPLDWGHAVLNTEDDTFGFALELLNKRDTLAHITGASPTR